VLPALLIAIALATGPPPTRQIHYEEKAPELAAARLRVPQSGEALLFSTAIWGHKYRFAMRATRATGARTCRVTLVRLYRRLDGSIQRKDDWSFGLNPVETDTLFNAVVELQGSHADERVVVLDGTTVELRRYSAGKLAYEYSANGPAGMDFASVLLDLVRHHVPQRELPRNSSWNYEQAAPPGQD